MNVIKVVVVGPSVLLYRERSAKAQFTPRPHALENTKLSADQSRYSDLHKIEQNSAYEPFGPKKLGSKV